MATGEILLPIQAAMLPVANCPSLKRHVSSGAETPGGWILAFDDAQSEYIYYTIKIPANYASGPVLKVYYSMATATADEVRWNCNVMCATEDVDDLDTAAADADNAVDDTVPDVAGEFSIASIALANYDGMAVDDLCILKVEREGGHANDDASGDAELWLVAFQYTMT